jgi:toxin YoeB
MPYPPPSWEPQAAWQYLSWKRHGPRIAERIDRLIKSIRVNPFEGIGKPEYLNGYWTRRITQKHRLAYEVAAG